MRHAVLTSLYVNPGDVYDEVMRHAGGAVGVRHKVQSGDCNAPCTQVPGIKELRIHNLGSNNLKQHCIS